MPSNRIAVSRNGKRGSAAPSLVSAALLGMLIGLGGYTFHYGEGFSYFSKDPKACVNCHIMQPQFDSWQKSSHHGVATCVDCHLPHNTVPKLIAKAENGFWHSKGFTFQDFPEPIFIRERNLEILLANCRECHSAIVHGMAPSTGPESIDCVHCHRSVGHGETVGMGKYLPAETAEAAVDNLDLQQPLER